ncbi:MAG TPA: metallophosphoesterase [Paraburkholderia sp.]
MTTPYIHRYTKNKAGRDFAVGDIHGSFSALEAALKYIGFDETIDRLFSVGDLVDRGPESEDADEWLSRPWFHAVRGNHEQMAIDAVKGFFDPHNYMANGGAWFMALPKIHQGCIADMFSVLPFAIEVETEAGLVGIVHANSPVANWADLRDALTGHNGEAFQMMCLWDRNRIQSEDQSGVEGVRAVIVGHTPLKRAAVLGNVYHIDTGAVFRDGYFTFINLATLEMIPAMPKKLEWSEA